jgi:pilus assembly protein CpaF
MSFHLILPFFPEELRELLLDPSISDLMINGTTGVYADRGGVVEHIPLTTPYTNDRLQAAIERVARILGQDLTSQNPILNTRLPDGSRVAVVGAPSSIHGPTLTVRKFNRWFTSDELIASGSLAVEVRDIVVDLVNQKKNGIISGGTGSGKTTLMKALLDHVPLNERLVVIEQPAELKMTLEAKCMRDEPGIEPDFDLHWHLDQPWIRLRYAQRRIIRLAESNKWKRVTYSSGE